MSPPRRQAEAARTVVMLATLGIHAALVAAPAASHAADLYGVFVGSNQPGGDFGALRYARRDAERMRDVLTELSSLTHGRTWTVLDGTPDDVRDAIEQLERTIDIDHMQRGASAGESHVVFYFSGHASRGGLLLDGQLLPLDEIRRWLIASRASIRIAFVDACQSGALTRLKAATRAPPLVELEEASGHVIITSSAHDEFSQESDDLGGSFFTHYLLSALRGDADHSGDGAVSLREAYAYTYARTVAGTVTSRGGVQHPSYGYRVRGRGDIILTRPGGMSSALLFAEDLEGTYLVYDRSKRIVVAEVTKQRGASRLIGMSPGAFSIKRRRDDDVLLLNGELHAGERRLIDEGGFVPVAYVDDTTKGMVRLGHVDRQWRLALFAGGELFFDAPTREELFYDSAQLGIRVELDGLLQRRLSLSIDLVHGGGEDDSTARLGTSLRQPVAVRFSRTQIGATLFFGMSRGMLSAQIGPRLTFLHAVRQFGAPFDDLAPQSFSAISPGLAGMVRITIGALSVFAEARVHYLYYSIDQNSRSLGYGGVYAGLEYAL